MRISEFREWARRKLGDDGKCTVRVELTDGQLDQALEDAKDWFNAFHGLHKEASLQYTGSQIDHDLSAVTPRVDEVLKVWFSQTTELIDFRGLYPGFLDINGFPYGTMGFEIGDNPQGTIVQTLQTIESSQRILSADPDWEFYRDDIDQNNPIRLLRLMPPPEESGKLIYFYRVDPRDIKLRMYKQRDLFMIREWALAEAKYMLGRIRGKYSGGLPAAGGDRTLDGEALIQESREDKENLERKILDYDGPVLPVIG